MKQILLLTSMLFLLTSCKQEEREIVLGKSPNEAISLYVTGKRDSPVSPWITNLVAEGSGLKGNISFEYYGSDISNEHITAVWEGNEKCTITFKEKDGSTRIFELTPNNNTAMWRDLSKK